MKTYTQQELTLILDAHKRWLNNEEGGERANLDNASLDNASLDNASLIGASLIDASLRGASLRGASLIGASLDKKYYSATRIGSRNSMTTYCFEDDIIWCGCFKGTLKEFEAQVKINHATNPLYLMQYLEFVKYCKKLMKYYKANNLLFKVA